MYFCLRTAETPYLSLLPDITPTDQRSTASGIMNLCGSIGLISCFAATSVIWGRSPSAVFFGVGLVCLASMLSTVTFVREPATVPEAASNALGPSDYLRSLREESNVLVYLAGQTLWWLGFYMVSSFATLFVVEELGAPEAKSFLVLMAFSIIAALFMLPLGMLGDRFGRKAILSSMVALWAVAQLVVGLSQNLTHALITVGLSAIPFAGIMAVGYAFFLDLIPRRRTAEFVGISVVSIAIAVMLGRLTGGALIDAFGYRSIFPGATAIMLVGFGILQLVKPRAETETDLEESPDSRI
jgi:MFS family permease